MGEIELTLDKESFGRSLKVIMDSLLANPLQRNFWFVDNEGLVVIHTNGQLPALLIRKSNGSWITSIEISSEMGFDYILEVFYRVYKEVKHLIA